jgi:hypothetical protein
MAHKEPYDEVKRIDALGRINLGKEHANETYSVEKLKDGTLVLTPVAVIPKREMWLWKNKTALKAVKEGLEQSAKGETEFLGSFAQYVEDEEE